jgi:hypothetical protein
VLCVHQHAGGGQGVSPKEVKRAEEFVRVLLAATPAPVCEDIGMCVLKDIPDIENQFAKLDIILRESTLPFWRECIRLTDDGHRVCAIGSPGIGKSTTTVVLIKELLEAGKTVVYLRRTKARDAGDGNAGGFMYEFTPTAGGGVTTAVHPEYPFSQHVKIESLKNPNTTFIIDPAKTQDSSDPSIYVLAKVIINASPDSKHWGGNEFSKRRGLNPEGYFLYYGTWSIFELVAAAPHINPNLNQEQILARFRLFGGIPRHVFALDVVAAKQKQAVGVNSITDIQAAQIGNNCVPEINTQDTNQPQSSVMGYVSESPFVKPIPVIISEEVKEQIWFKHLGILWDQMLRTPNGTWADAFEAFVRKLMCNPVGEGKPGNRFNSRPAVGKKRPADHVPVCMYLPQCIKICEEDDIIAAVRGGGDCVIYHSVNKQYPLIDFIFKASKVFYAVQATVGKTHDAKGKAIAELLTNLSMEDDEALRILYAVPQEHFKSFTTIKVAPLEDFAAHVNGSGTLSALKPFIGNERLQVIVISIAPKIEPALYAGGAGADADDADADEHMYRK